MRFTQDSNNSSLTTLESQPPPPVIFPATVPLLNASTGFPPESSPFYHPASSYLDVRPRLGSSTSSVGMANAPRSHPLPNLGYKTTRDIYSSVTPGYTRALDHPQRSPPFSVHSRRHPLSPTPSPGLGFTTNPIRTMDPPYGAKSNQNIPPLQGIQQHGQLAYATGHSPIKVEINGTIDKGFFLSEGEWTCYRRNYFSCICSYSLTPNYPGAAMHYTPNSSATHYEVFGFAMSISAMVHESDTHTIDLVQHTPKRDKGPVSRPDRVELSPKPPQQTPHPLGTLYPDSHGHSHRLGVGGASGGLYDGFSQSPSGHPTEHTFERIQFKQATANNGKRRAAQQYYHLVVELHAHVGEIGRGVADQWMKVAHRKSAKMIVRGRSPGHYQSERRGSASSGPGAAGGSLSGYAPQMQDYGPGSSMLGSTYSTGNYEHRGQYGGHNRPHDLPMEPVMSVEDVKALDSSKDYQYYPTPIYEGNDTRQGIEMFTHRTDSEPVVTSMADSLDPSASRLKNEHDTLPSLFYPNQSQAYNNMSRGCSRFEGKSTSAGYYPQMMPQST
ncbi:female sexual development-1 protein- variant 2 [Apiospora arundinis]|uniref:NDT80/PhoG like DNA-binding family protein n=1 Tax=Apiospora arundinis TaxID=335852 RepID=A0ABR2IT13_9PEZI